MKSILFSIMFVLVSFCYSAELIQIGPDLPSKEELQNLKKRKVSPSTLRGQEGVKILDVPKFNWVYGCVPTTFGMLVGYYDRNGYPNLYTGTEGNGVCPETNEVWPLTEESGEGTMGECPFIASKTHIRDFWVATGSSKDPFYNYELDTRNWDPDWDPYKDYSVYPPVPYKDSSDCLADYCGTSQGIYTKQHDGSSGIGFSTTGEPTTADIYCNEWLGDAVVGAGRFIHSNGYAVSSWFNQLADTVHENGATFEQYCAEIDAGRPVGVVVTSHMVLGVGYNIPERKIYLHDTWTFEVQEMEWDGYYGIGPFGPRELTGICVIRLAPSTDVTTQVTFTATTGGTTYPSGAVKVESAQTLTAVVNEGYKFVGWSSTGAISIASPYELTTTITVAAEGTVTANFEKLPVYHTVTFVTGVNGTVEGELVQSVLQGYFSSSVTAVADDGYEFSSWTGDYEGSINPLVIDNVVASITVQANFSEVIVPPPPPPPPVVYHTVTYTVNGEGYLVGSTTQVVEQGGSTGWVEAIANEGYEFTGWTGSYTGVANPLQITNVDDNKDVVANFIKIEEPPPPPPPEPTVVETTLQKLSMKTSRSYTTMRFIMSGVGPRENKIATTFKINGTVVKTIPYTMWHERGNSWSSGTVKVKLYLPEVLIYGDTITIELEHGDYIYKATRTVTSTMNLSKKKSFSYKYRTGKGYTLSAKCDVAIDDFDDNELEVRVGDNSYTMSKSLKSKTLTYSSVNGIIRFKDGVCTMRLKDKVSDNLASDGKVEVELLGTKHELVPDSCKQGVK